MGRLGIGPFRRPTGPMTMVRMQAADSAHPDQLRIVLVDADDLVRESLAGLLGIGDRIKVVGSAGQTDEAMQLILTVVPDAVVIDPRMPELATGLAFIGRVKAVAPKVQVLVMGSAELVEQAGLSDRVDGCVRKTFRPNDLTAAILAAGRRSLD
jgi:DNA-binding NarL/FixJ family response regulator